MKKTFDGTKLSYNGSIFHHMPKIIQLCCFEILVVLPPPPPPAPPKAFCLSNLNFKTKICQNFPKKLIQQKKSLIICHNIILIFLEKY
jgi:hypothetical protein